MARNQVRELRLTVVCYLLVCYRILGRRRPLPIRVRVR